MIETRHLHTFEAVVRTGSFAAAARELGYTQPAISQQIRALERELDAALFLRAGRGLKLSESGQILASRVPALLADLAATRERITAVRRLRDGRVRVCAFPSANATLVPTAMAKMRADHLDIEVELFEAEPPESIDRLRAGEHDVVVAFRYETDVEEEDGDLTSVTLAEDPLVLLAPAGHPVARVQQVDLTDLAGEHWVAGCVRCRRAFVEACEEAGFAPRIDITTDDTLAIQSYVAAGLGLALVPRMTQAFVLHPRLRMRPVSPLRHRVITAVTRADPAPPLALRHMMSTLRWAARQIAAPEVP